MSNDLGLSVVALVILIGSSAIKGKKIVSRFGEECVNFEEKKLQYHLPDNILPWDKLSELKPCCVEDEEVPGCTVCDGNVVWKLDSKDYGPTICTAIPKPRVITDDFKVWSNSRRLIAAGLDPSVRSRDPNYMSSGSTESPADKPWARRLIHYLGRDEGFREWENSQRIRSKNSPQISQELRPPVQKSESNQPHPRMYFSGEEPVDQRSEFLKKMFPQLFISDQPVNITAIPIDIDENKESDVSIDCTFPVHQISFSPSNLYRERDETPWGPDNTGIPEAPVQEPKHVNAVGQENGEKIFPTGRNAKSKRTRRNRETVKRKLS